ncbi:hypothetical protein XBLMG947_1362 [Xanthomonas bromi]|uniref:Uncharacterized protein n=2 Tax=Xanthomonas bromi TaxID=56449 RepID=A0A1C3NJJ4_9XANT|nr:hypothetical protein XBLMG947_1362 [Xanthomonas bromi]
MRQLAVKIAQGLVGLSRRRQAFRTQQFTALWQLAGRTLQGSHQLGAARIVLGFVSRERGKDIRRVFCMEDTTHPIAKTMEIEYKPMRI